MLFLTIWGEGKTRSKKKKRTEKSMTPTPSVLVLGRIVLVRDDETASSARPAIDNLDEVDELLDVVHGPVDFVVVARPEVDHDVLIAEEEHGRARVVELVHLVKVGRLVNVNEIDDAEIFDFFYGAERYI